MKRYRWPICTMPECGHGRSHTTEAAANRLAKDYQRRWTTPHGDAVCKCHDGALPDREMPRFQFRCDEGKAAKAAEPVLATVENFGGASVDPDPFSAPQPIDPRDNR